MFARRVPVTVCDRANTPPPHHHQTTPSRQQDKKQQQKDQSKTQGRENQSEERRESILWCEIKARSEASLNHGLLILLYQMLQLQAQRAPDDGKNKKQNNAWHTLVGWT